MVIGGIAVLEAIMKRPRTHASWSAASSSRRRQSPRLANQVVLLKPTVLLDLPDEALAQIYRHTLKRKRVKQNSFQNLRDGFSLASTCRRLRQIFFSSIHAFDATKTFVPFHEERRPYQCQCCGRVCVNPARAIISRAAPNLRFLGLPDSLTLSILSMVADRCVLLRQLINVQG